MSLTFHTSGEKRAKKVVISSNSLLIKLFPVQGSRAKATFGISRSVKTSLHSYAPKHVRRKTDVCFSLVPACHFSSLCETDEKVILAFDSVMGGN